MYCQKCRTPLKLDGSLEHLNPAAFDLLIGSTGKSLPDRQHAPYPPSAFPPERRDLYNQAARHATSPVYKKTVGAPRYGPQSVGQSKLAQRDGPGMSFVMLSDSQIPTIKPSPDASADSHRGSVRQEGFAETPGNNDKDAAFSDQMERTARLFEIVSARSDIDHPICIECTDLLVEGLQQRLAAATKERDAYISFLKNLNASIPSAEEVKAAEANLEATLKAESEAFEELLALEKEKAAVDKEIAELEEESQKLDLEEKQFWRDRNAFALTLSEFQNERDALNRKYDHDSRQLERLQRTNVYNDTFCISHDGYFGTINGLRLGRLSNQPVEWAEINAAWGQTLLLLATVAEKLGFQFEGYKLRPMGSFSKIDKIEYPQQSSPYQSQSHNNNSRTTQTRTSAPKITSLELFSSGDLPLNLPWLHRRFDAGMVAFLDCLNQLGSYVERTTANTLPSHSPSPARRLQQHHQQQTGGLKLPYEINRDRIGDASIKLGFNQNDETWTRACKYTLTCCKFLLAHASNVASGQRAAIVSATTGGT
ncbi:hypothetical protein VTO42DRAFT_808 [Malbranchea cinnamomea]